MKFYNYIALSTFSLSAYAIGGNHWDFTWRDANLKSHVENGKGARSCTPIAHDAGLVFNWDRELFSGCYIYLYSDHLCLDQIGLSCPDWKKEASQDINGFRVTDC